MSLKPVFACLSHQQMPDTNGESFKDREGGDTSFAPFASTCLLLQRLQAIGHSISGSLEEIMLKVSRNRNLGDELWRESGQAL